MQFSFAKWSSKSIGLLLIGLGSVVLSACSSTDTNQNTTSSNSLITVKSNIQAKDSELNELNKTEEQDLLVTVDGELINRCIDKSAESCALVADLYRQRFEQTASDEDLEFLAHFAGIACELDNTYCLQKALMLSLAKKTKLDLGEEYSKINLDDEITKAFALATKSSNEEVAAVAMINLGVQYEEQGKIKEARKSFSKACDLKIAQGCLNLANNYRQTKEFVKALEADKKGCELKDSNSCYNLGVSLELKGAKTKELIKAFEQACNLGAAIACDKAASLMQQANMHSAAFTTLYKGCDLGSGSACFNLGMLSYKEKGAEVAVAPLTRGCELNDSASCFNLGSILYKLKHEKEGFAAYQRSCELEFGQACRKLGEIYQAQRQKDKALQVFDHGCELKDAKACAYLAAMYMSKEETNFDLQKAINYLEKSCALGSQEACNAIKQLEQGGTKVGEISSKSEQTK